MDYYDLKRKKKKDIQCNNCFNHVSEFVSKYELDNGGDNWVLWKQRLNYYSFIINVNQFSFDHRSCDIFTFKMLRC